MVKLASHTSGLRNQVIQTKLQLGLIVRHLSSSSVSAHSAQRPYASGSWDKHRNRSG
jgi:hypothetical protein